eukprot:260684_1
MASNEVVYCGIDDKMLFDAFNVDNYSPLSTSACPIVASNFATTAGIVLVLQRMDAVNCSYFDMVPFSNYRHEKEKLFCRAKLVISDIIVGTQHNSENILALQLLQLILSGSLFCYEFNANKFSDRIQEILCNFLRAYVSGNINNNKYVSQLLVTLINSYKIRNEDNDPYGYKIIFINVREMQKLNNKTLSKYFYSTSPVTTKRGSLFSCNGLRDINVNYIKPFKKMTLDSEQLKKMQNEQTVDIGEVNVNNYVFSLVFQKEKIENVEYFISF